MSKWETCALAERLLYVGLLARSGCCLVLGPTDLTFTSRELYLLHAAPADSVALRPCCRLRLDHTWPVWLLFTLASLLLTPVGVTPALPLPRGSPRSWSVWLRGACCLLTLPLLWFLLRAPPAHVDGGPPSFWLLSPCSLGRLLALCYPGSRSGWFPNPRVLCHRAPAVPWLLLTRAPRPSASATGGSCPLQAVPGLENPHGGREEESDPPSARPTPGPPAGPPRKGWLLTHLTLEEAKVPSGEATRLGWPPRRLGRESGSTARP